MFAPPESLDDLWPTVEPMIARALSHSIGEYTTADVLAALRDHSSGWSLLVVLEGSEIAAVAVVQVLEYPHQKQLFVLALAGRDMSRWVGHLDEVLEAGARQVGATAICCAVRKGLTRTLAPLGYHEAYTVLARHV